jgi:hypothetical protein
MLYKHKPSSLITLSIKKDHIKIRWLGLKINAHMDRQREYVLYYVIVYVTGGKPIAV